MNTNIMKTAGFLFMLFSIALLVIVQRNQLPSPLPIEQEPLINEQFDSITKMLRCPACLESDNQFHDKITFETDIEASVQQLLNDGFNEEEIINYLVDRYGYFALTHIHPIMTGWILWFAPMCLFLTGLGLIFYVAQTKGLRAFQFGLIKARIFTSSKLLLMAITGGIVFYVLFGSWRQVTYWREVQAHHPDVAEILTKQDHEAFTTEKIEALVLSLRTQLEKEDDNVSNWLLLGSLNLELLNYQQALQAFSIAYQRSPDDYIVKNAYGQLLISSYNPALREFGKSLLNEVVKENRYNTDAWESLAKYYYSIEQYEKALIIWQLLLTQLPSFSEKRQILERNIERAKSASDQ